MNKPTAFAYLLGNSFSVTCASALSGYFLLVLAQSGFVNGYALIFCISLTGFRMAITPAPEGIQEHHRHGSRAPRGAVHGHARLAGDGRMAR